LIQKVQRLEKKTYPEDELDIAAVPRVAKVMGEETPGVVVVLVREQDTNSATIRTVANVETFGGPVTPDDAQEEWTSRGHDSDVGENPFAVVAGQVVNDTQEEWVTRNRAHCVVGDTGRQSAAHPGGVGEQRIQATVATIVQVEINTTVVGEDKVTDRVGALNGVFVVVKGLEEPGVLGSDKLA